MKVRVHLKIGTKRVKSSFNHNKEFGFQIIQNSTGYLSGKACDFSDYCQKFVREKFKAY